MTTNELAMFKSSLDLATTDKVDTWQELSDFVAVVKEIHVLAAMATFDPSANVNVSLSDTDFALLGIRGVTEDNLDALLKLIAETFNDVAPPSLSGIQALVNGLASLADGQRVLVDLVKAYDGTPENTEAITLNYNAAGLDQVQDKHLDGLNRVFLALVDRDERDSFGEVRTLVNQYFSAYSVLEAAADGNGSTPSQANPYPAMLTAGDFASLGLNQVSSAVEIKLANDLISHLNFTSVESSEQQIQLADLVDNLLALAAGSGVSDRISLAALHHAGITHVTADSLYAFLSLVASSNDNGSQIDTLAELQQLALDGVALQISSLAEIQAYSSAAINALPSPAPDTETFARAGIVGVTQANTSTLLSVLASTPVSGSEVQSIADVQRIVDAMTTVMTDATQATRQDYASLGISLGAIALPSDPTIGQTTSNNALQLFNEIIANSFESLTDSVASIDSFNELQTMSTLVTALYGLAAAPSASILAPVAGITLETLALAGLDMLDPISFESFLQLVNQTAADGAAINTYEELLALAQQAVVQGAAISAIRAFAQTNAGTSPVLQTYQVAGVTGLTDANGQPNTVLLRAVNEALLTASVNGQSVDTTAEIQAVVNAYSRTLFEANGTASDATVADPTHADFLLIGATHAGGLSAEGLSVLNDVIGNKSVLGVDSVSEIEDLALTIDGLMTLQSEGTWVAGATLPTSLSLNQGMLDALKELGISGLEVSDLPKFFETLAAQPSASSMDSLAELQAIASRVIEENALNVLRNYANNNSGVAPTRREYNILGISGLTNTLLASYNDALATVSLELDLTNSIAKQQVIDMTNAFQKIFTEANGLQLDSDPLLTPNRADYLAIGSTVASTLANGSTAQSLLTDAIATGTQTAVDRVSKIDALARVAEKVTSAADVALQPVNLVVQDLILLGLHGINEFVLAQLLIDIAATPDDGSAVDSLAELQAVIDAISDRMPTVSGVSISISSRAGTSSFITNQLNQTITASLDTVLDPTRYQVFGRVDGEVSSGVSGWVNVSSFVTGNMLTWSNVTLESGNGRSIQLKIVDTLIGSERESPVLNRSYRYLDPAVFASLIPPTLRLEADYPIVAGMPEVPGGNLRLSLSIAAPAETGELRLFISDASNPNPVEIASLYHAATRSLIPLYPLPEGEWSVQYKMFDLAGNGSQISGSLSVRIVSPQNMLSQEDPYSYGVGAGSRLLEAISRDAVSVGGTNTSVTIDASGKRLDLINQLNMDPTLNAGSSLRAEIQIDNVAVRPDGTAVALAQRDVDARFDAGQYGDFVFEATDVIMFRLYPQVVAQDGSVVDAADKALFANRVTQAYTGALHQVDLKIAEGVYGVSDYEVTYYKSMPDGTVIAFDWDAETGTGGTFYDTNNDGSYDLITLFIRDGGRGDVDGKADGVILDPGFAVFFQRSVPAPVVPVVPVTPVTPVVPVLPVVPEVPVTPVGPVVSENVLTSVIPGNLDFLRTPIPLGALTGLNMREVFSNLQEPVPQFIMPSYQDGMFQNGRFAFLRGWSTSDVSLLRIHDLFHPVQTSDYLEVRQSFDVVENPRITSSEGFRMTVIEVSGQPLAVYRGQQDLTLEAGIATEYQIQPDVFAHADPKAVVMLKMSQIDGKAIPAWIQFNGKTGKLLVQPPEGVSGDFVIRLVALDQAGREVVTIFRISISPRGEIGVGRTSFSDKIKQSMQGLAFNFVRNEG
jgi:hypothetical protein